MTGAWYFLSFHTYWYFYNWYFYKWYFYNWTLIKSCEATQYILKHEVCLDLTGWSVYCGWLHWYSHRTLAHWVFLPISISAMVKARWLMLYYRYLRACNMSSKLNIWFNQAQWPRFCFDCSEQSYIFPQIIFSRSEHRFCKYLTLAKSFLVAYHLYATMCTMSCRQFQLHWCM